MKLCGMITVGNVVIWHNCNVEIPQFLNISKSEAVMDGITVDHAGSIHDNTSRLTHPLSGAFCLDQGIEKNEF
jgi:hypothetical protein